MINKVLSTYPHTNALTVPTDAFVSIGEGLEVMLPVGAKSGDSWLITLEHFKTDRPVVHTTQGRETFITSSTELLSQLQSNLVTCPNDTKQVFKLPEREPISQPNHRSDMLVSFFNHLFLVKGRTLWWTDLDNPFEWAPHPHNEADFRIIEWETESATGLTRSADKLYLHFPNAIYEITYVGKPSIVTIVARVHGIGCVTPRSLSVHNTVQFFIGSDNFYAWSPETGLATIGQDVWNRFIAQRGPLHETWSYVDQRNNEICWVSGPNIWAFNFIEKHWQKYSSDGILSHTTVPWLAPVGSETTIEKDQIDGLENVWVTDSTVCREARFDDDISRCLTMTQPYLESDDITYGDLHFIKRCDLIMLDMQTSFPWTGVRVFLSGRDFVSHPNNWVDCGVWTQDSPGKQIDFRTIMGKVLKFRFELVDSLHWNGLLPNGGLSLNGKTLDIANGEIIMNGNRTDFRGRQFLQLDGTVSIEQTNTPRLGFAELNAWGERVDLPQTLIGPDK